MITLYKKEEMVYLKDLIYNIISSILNKIMVRGDNIGEIK